MKRGEVFAGEEVAFPVPIGVVEIGRHRAARPFHQVKFEGEHAPVAQGHYGQLVLFSGIKLNGLHLVEGAPRG